MYERRRGNIAKESHAFCAVSLKVHKREKFFVSDFEFFTIL